MMKIAAHQLEAAVEDIVYDRSNGNMYVKGAPDKNRAFAAIAFSALTADIPEGMEPSLEEMATYDPANFTFPNSAHICMVELDKDTCEVEITHYTAVDDVRQYHQSARR